MFNSSNIIIDCLFVHCYFSSPGKLVKVIDAESKSESEASEVVPREKCFSYFFSSKKPETPESSPSPASLEQQEENYHYHIKSPHGHEPVPASPTNLCLIRLLPKRTDTTWTHPKSRISSLSHPISSFNPNSWNSIPISI